jgi:hypothetical protein
MSNTLSKKEKNAIKILGNDLANIIINKIKVDFLNLNYITEKRFNNIIYSIFNYIESNPSLSYSDIDSMDLKIIENVWDSYLQKYISNYTSTNFVETNKIIDDYRINGIGLYWVDLEKLFCIDSMIRMNDCGRVNYGHTTLELREQLDDSNESHMIIVYEIKTGNIRQVKGKSSQKPDSKYWKYFYKFLINTSYKINEYVPTYKSESDLNILDFPINIQKEIYLKHPTLNKNLI